MEEIDPKYIRISSILSIIPTLGSDQKWGFPIQSIDPDILQRKADLGSNVHQAIADHIRNEFCVITEKEQAYMNSYLKWEKSIDLKCHEVEKRFYYEPMKLTGCIDMIGKIEGENLYRIIDFKCTVSPDHVKWRLQAAFYAFLAQVNEMKLDSTCFFVQLNSNGDYPKVHKYEITKELTTTALSLYNFYMYLTRS